MTTEPSFNPRDNGLATRLGRYWDALINERPTPAITDPDLGELAALVDELSQLGRDPAPESIHQLVKAKIAGTPGWPELLATRPHEIAATPVSMNGHAHVDDPPPDRGRIRRIGPMFGAAMLTATIAATIALLLYLAWGMDRHADQPVSTPLPAPTLAPPTTTVTTGSVGDWPMLGGGPSRTGGADRTIPAAAPALTWTATLGSGFRAPVAAGNAVYVTNGGELVALNAASGEELWHFDLGVTPSRAGANPPAVVGGVVYVAAHDGTIFAIDASTGQSHWTFETGETVSTSVAVADGALFVGTIEGDLFALDAATGEQRWIASPGSIAISSPVVADGVVYVGAGGNQLVALDAATGANRWKQSVKAGMQSVAVGDGIVIAAGVNSSSDTLLIAVDAASGAVRWQGGSASDLPPAIVAGTVYVANGGGVTALSDQRGAQRWGFNATLSLVDIVVSGDALLLCRQDGTVIALDSTRGNERWRLSTGSDATGVALGNAAYYVAHKDGSIAKYG